ncbi:MAG: hypothetical protein JXA44_08790, partial [Methanospirillaceae archaeon]|nr:hypothetical protein [Methanospirillaceae archaeon]
HIILACLPGLVFSRCDTMMQNAIFYSNTKQQFIGMLAVIGVSGRRDLFVPNCSGTTDRLNDLHFSLAAKRKAGDEVLKT